MFRGIGAAVIGVIAMMAIAAGCGGSSDDSLTKAEYVKQGNAICKKGLEQKSNAIRAAFEKALKNPAKGTEREAQEELVLDVALPPVRNMQEELVELGVPSDEGEQAEAMTAALDSAVTKAESNPDLALDSPEKLFGESNEMATKYGMSACGQV